MAERKIGDVVIGVIVGIFVLAAFSIIVTEFDSKTTNNEDIGSVLFGVYNESDESYKNTEVSVVEQSYNTSNYVLVTGADQDPRGTGQVITMARDSPSTIQNYTNNMASIMPLDESILGFLISIVVVVTVILFFRFLRPGGA